MMKKPTLFIILCAFAVALSACSLRPRLSEVDYAADAKPINTAEKIQHIRDVHE